MITLYFHHTPNPVKVAIMLEETGLAYDVIGVDMYKGDQHAPDYRAINPNGKVPAITDDGVTVFDSNAILLYLAEKTSRFSGTTAERPAMLSWLMFTASGLGPFTGQAVHFTQAHTDSSYATHRYSREVERHLTVLEKRLAAVPYLAGSSYTIADIAAWAWVDYLVRTGFVLSEAAGPARWPQVLRWHQDISARPAVERARAVGKSLTLKSAFDEQTMRALFPQNFEGAL